MTSIKFPRKIERKLVQNLCDNLREHPKEWSYQNDRAVHQDGIHIWMDSDFWGRNTIYEPNRVHLGWHSKHKLWQALKYSKEHAAPHISNTLEAWIEENKTAAHLARLSSKKNDPIIKYRERFGIEPPKEIADLAENGKLMESEQSGVA